MRGRQATTAIWLTLLAGAAAMLFPPYWMIATAIRPRSEVFEPVVRLIPGVLTAENFVDLWTRYPLLTWVLNPTFIAVAAVVLTVSANPLCGYVFAKFRFPGRDVLFFAILGALMIPIQVILVPEFLVVS